MRARSCRPRTSSFKLCYGAAPLRFAGSCAISGNVAPYAFGCSRTPSESANAPAGSWSGTAPNSCACEDTVCCTFRKTRRVGSARRSGSTWILRGAASETMDTYRVRARNTTPDSENRIHDDQTAAAHGFRAGLVPGVTVYGYLTVPVIDRFGEDWLARGGMRVRFLQPVYAGEEVVVTLFGNDVTASRTDETGCATGEIFWSADAPPDLALPPAEPFHAVRPPAGRTNRWAPRARSSGPRTRHRIWHSPPRNRCRPCARPHPPSPSPLAGFWARCTPTCRCQTPRRCSRFPIAC